MGQIELLSVIRELKELKNYKETLEAEITALEDRVKAEMTARDTEEIQVDIFKVRWTKIISRRFDTTAFKTACSDLYTKFSKETETRRFTIA